MILDRPIPRAALALPIAALAAAAAAGCLPALRGKDDSGRLAALAVDSARPALQRLDDPDPAVRENACRALASDAERLRRQGEFAAAEQHVHWIVDRFDRENDLGVRHAVVNLCAPAMGRGGSPATEAFLRRRIVAGELAGPAALVLADLAPPEAYEILAPLTRHPLPSTRADGALALVILGDPRGAPAVRGVIAEMHPPGWPKQLWGVALDDARASLAIRAGRAFGIE